MRQELAAPLVAELEHWLRQQRATLARHNPVAVATDYMLKDWTAFTRFLADGRICLTNNAAERALRGVALGRKSWMFAGSDRGGQRAAFMYSLIVTAKLNDIDPQAWLADVLARIADLPQHRLAELTPLELATRHLKRSDRSSRLSVSPRPCGPHRMRTALTLSHRQILANRASRSHIKSTAATIRRACPQTSGRGRTEIRLIVSS